MAEKFIRDCNKCIHHLSGACDAWECQGTVTLEDYAKEVRKKALEEVAVKVNRVMLGLYVNNDDVKGGAESDSKTAN